MAQAFPLIYGGTNFSGVVFGLSTEAKKKITRPLDSRAGSTEMIIQQTVRQRKGSSGKVVENVTVEFVGTTGSGLGKSD